MLPLCDEGAGSLSVGHWHFHNATAMPKSFTACQGPFDSTRFEFFGHHIPLELPPWSGGLEAQLHQACMCDRASARGIRRKSELYEWRPDACHMHAWDAKRFCHELRGRQLLIVGDSTLFQFAWTLWSMSKPTCHEQIHFNNSDTLLGGCMGNLGRGAALQAILHERISSGQRPDIVIVGAGGHVYRHLCHYSPHDKDPKCKPGPARCTAPGVDAYKKLVNYVKNRQLANVTALNATEHVEAMRAVLDATLDVAAEHNASSEKGIKFIWKSQSPAHQNCGSAVLSGETRRFEGFNTSTAGIGRQFGHSTGWLYNWPSFPAFDLEAKVAAARSGGLLSFMDISMLYDRPDGHCQLLTHNTDQPTEPNPNFDCLHYCTPGPLDEAARVLQHLLQLLSGGREMHFG